MTVELRPLGNACNIECSYCYQKFMRKEEEKKEYNIQLMLNTADRLLTNGNKGKHFSMFGGEPLLIPINDLEIFFKHGMEKYGRNSIQTNGTLITDRHIDIFKRYNVSVGISIDGPSSCNDARRVGGNTETKKSTERTEQGIENLLRNGITPSFIITLHRINYLRMEEFNNWLHKLEEKGIKHARLHFLENDDADELVLSTEELFSFLMNILNLNLKIRFDLFDEIQNQLLYDEKERKEKEITLSCTWNGCDPLTTPAVQGIDGEGNLHNCGRTNKTKVDYIKADKHGKERLLSLFFTPQKFNGCQGCSYFFACKGHCPGEGVKGDWRNRTEFCEVLKLLFGEFERRIEAIGKTPISKNLIKRMEIERNILGINYSFDVPVKSCSSGPWCKESCDNHHHDGIIGEN